MWKQKYVKGNTSHKIIVKNPLYLWLTKFDLRWHSSRRALRFQVIRFHTCLIIIPILILREHIGAISTYSSSVILNCFRVLNTSGEIISFHLRKISIYPFRLRKHAEPTKKRKTSKSGCLQTIQLTKQKAEETKKDPVYHGYHLFNGAGAVAGPAALFDDWDWKSNVKIIDTDRGWLFLLDQFNMWFDSILKYIWIKLSKNEFVSSLQCNVIEERDMDEEWWNEVQYLFKNLDQIQSKTTNSFIEFIKLEIEN